MAQSKRVLLDTNVIAHAMLHDLPLYGAKILLTWIVIGEVEYGLALERKRKRLPSDPDWKSSLKRYRIEIIERCTDGISVEWGNLMALARRTGRQPQGIQNDMWIAATALQLRAPLMTFNHKDFEFIPKLKLIDPRA